MACRLSHILTLVLALVLLLGSTTGCHNPSRPQSPLADSALTPVVRGADMGLETRLWIIDNTPGILAGSLRNFKPPAFAENKIDLWKRNGLRVVAVPLTELDSLRESLPTIGPIHRSWLGLLPEWVELVGGTRLNHEQAVRFDSDQSHLGPGQLQLAARCWIEPKITIKEKSKTDLEQSPTPTDAPPRAQLHIEIMPQLKMPRTEERALLERLAQGDSIAPASGRDTITFDRLTLPLPADGSHAFLIVAENPSADWFAPASPRPESVLAPSPHHAMIGPTFPPVPTIGDLLLTNRIQPNAVNDARVVLILIPRVPERFELLPR